MGLVVLAALAVVGVGVHRRWVWARGVADRWDRIRPYVAAYMRCAPATFIYLFVLVIINQVLRSSPSALRHELLLLHSTNLDHLRHDPISVLTTSAFWVTGHELVIWIVLFPAVLAPAERWLGSLRGIGVFAIGHVGATLATAGILALLIGHGLAPEHLRHVVDVGSSYGFFCVAALFTYRLPGRWRWLWAGALVGGTALFVGINQAFTDYGHLISVLIGFALVPLTRSPAVRHRERWPIWEPPEMMVEAERERIAVHRRLVHGDGP